MRLPGISRSIPRSFAFTPEDSRRPQRSRKSSLTMRRKISAVRCKMGCSQVDYRGVRLTRDHLRVIPSRGDGEGPHNCESDPHKATARNSTFTLPSFAEALDRL